MCGIAGFIDFTNSSTLLTLEKMIGSLRHRGPDDLGFEIYNLQTVKLGFAQARLSIIDLSQAAHQPMHYLHLSIVFNGEIYNYKKIKDELASLGHVFNSESDTEVILHAFAQWGIDSIQHFIGMFAIVIFDRKNELIYFINDRVGVKPLYYYFKNGLFLFGSELKAFHQHERFIPLIDKVSIRLYFQNIHHGYIPAPYTIFEDTYKLEQGSILKLDLNTKKVSLTKYWDLTSFYLKPKLSLSFEEASSELHKLLQSAFSYRMVSDVPVGIFLSGGYDSTAVTAILQGMQTNKIKTFTIGFDEGNNETPFAKQTSNLLRTEHYEYICTTKEAQSIIPHLPYYYDEPFADSSAIPTILVSQLAKEHVSVSLSADGGDEIFSGYDRYVKLLKNLKTLNRIPDPLKPIAPTILHLINNLIPESKSDLKHKVTIYAKSLNRNKLQQSINLFQLSFTLPINIYNRIFAENINIDNFMQTIGTKDSFDAIELALLWDFRFYLQNDIMTKVDRACMSVSLEGREPLLDHRIIEFAAQLPFSYKFDGVTTKRILKNIVHRYVPENMMNRPKAGFTLPIYSWLRADLSYLLNEYLNSNALKASGLFNVNYVENIIAEFKINKFYYQPLIWKLLMFQMWYFRWMEKKH
jgi:asparagine synthase (glutamine-hydrolysing)